jgi:hypothetical protein
MHHVLSGSPHVVDITEVERAGHILVWVRDRWDGNELVTDLLMKNLSTNQVRIVSRGGADDPATNGRKIVWNAPAGRPWQPLMRYDLTTGRRAVLSRVANDFSSLTRSPTISDRLLAWRTFALVAGRDTYSLVARDLRTGRNYHLATGGDTGTPGLIFSGPGWGWANHALWEQTVDGAGGHPRASYLAVTSVP